MLIPEFAATLEVFLMAEDGRVEFLTIHNLADYSFVNPGFTVEGLIQQLENQTKRTGQQFQTFMDGEFVADSRYKHAA